MKQHTTPCANCPFLRNQAGMITGERVEELADALERDIHFSCHKTIDYTNSEDGEGRTTAKTRLCAGSMIVTHRSGGHPSQMARIMGRCGAFKYEDIAQSTADCFDSFEDFIEAHYAKEKV